MSPETILAMAGLLAAATWTPGPNNAMLAASGATFGFRPTLPHIAGVALGFGVMLGLVSMGLGELLERIPQAYDAMHWAGALVFLWVAWKIANGGRARADADAKPFTFLQAASFQWVNPKAWAMCVALVAQFVTGEAPLQEAITMAVVSALIGTTSAVAWAGFGAALQGWLSVGHRLRIFNGAMALIIVVGVVALLVGYV